MKCDVEGENAWVLASLEIIILSSELGLCEQIGSRQLPSADIRESSNPFNKVIKKIGEKLIEDEISCSFFV